MFKTDKKGDGCTLEYVTNTVQYVQIIILVV